MSDRRDGLPKISRVVLNVQRNQSLQRERLPGCGSCVHAPEADEPTISEAGHIGYKCGDCGLIYISPRPNPESIANLYDHDHAQVSASQHLAASATLGRALKSRHTLRLIRQLVPSGTLLEIGAGGGAFARQASKHFSVHAAEFNPLQVAHMRQLGIDCRHGSFRENFRREQFDVIYHCDVLSHLSDPVAEFTAMRKLLKPGGVLAFETGNIGDVLPKYFPLFESWMYPDHLYLFSRQGLSNLAAATRFQPLVTREFSRLPEMYVMSYLRGFKAKHEGAANGPGFNRNVDLRYRALLNIKHLLEFFLIYLAGSLAPKEGRPQTIVSIWQPK